MSKIIKFRNHLFNKLTRRALLLLLYTKTCITISYSYTGTLYTWVSTTTKFYKNWLYELEKVGNIQTHTNFHLYYISVLNLGDSDRVRNVLLVRRRKR